MAPRRYDVAISSLADESIATALYNALSDGLNVFFYPREQRSAGLGQTGLSGCVCRSLRIPGSWWSYIERGGGKRHGPAWNRQPFRRAGCLEHGWRGLFFMMLDNASSPPMWLPSTHVRFNYPASGPNRRLELSRHGCRRRVVR